MPSPILFTERMILRVPEAQDFDAFAAMAGNAESMHFIGGQMGRPAAWRLFCALVGAWQVVGWSMFSMIDRDTGRWIGRTGPWTPEGWPGNEVGWAVAPEFAGKGYAHEAAVASVDYAVDILGWDDVMHTIDPENLPSIKLAQRLGATNRGRTQMPAPFEDKIVDDWGQSAESWKARRSARHNPKP